MLFVLRHGERADYAGPDEQAKIEVSHDTHLTDLGKIQARKAGDHLLKFVKEHCEATGKRSEDLKYLLLSSPFRRCIQTIFHVSQALPKENILDEKIYMNNFIAEFLCENYLPPDVLQNLQVRTDLP